MYTHVHIYIYIYMYMYIYKYIYIYIYTCIYIYIHIYIHDNTCIIIYMHIYTDKANLSWIGGLGSGGGVPFKHFLHFIHKLYTLYTSPTQAKKESPARQEEKGKGRRHDLGSNSTRQPDRAHACRHERNEMKRFPGWTHHQPPILLSLRTTIGGNGQSNSAQQRARVFWNCLSQMYIAYAACQSAWNLLFPEFSGVWCPEVGF